MRRAVMTAVAGLLGVAPASAAAQTLTSSKYVAAANGVCAGANKRLSRIRMPSGHSVPSLARYVARELTVSEQEVGQLQALAGPQPLQGQADAVYALVAQSNTLQQRLLIAIRQRDSSQAQSIHGQIDALLGRANAAADAIGLLTCGG